MTERKVATRQERYMFEQLIRQDMQNGIQRTISDNSKMNPNIPNNQGQNRTPITNNNNNQNYPQIQNSNGQTPQNNQNNNNVKNNNGIKRTLAQKFTIRTNKGKRDAVWEQKRQLKIAKYEQMMQEEQQYYEQQLSPKNTPSNMNRQNNNQQYQRATPNNQQRITPQQQYQRGSPNNGLDPRLFNNISNIKMFLWSKNMNIPNNSMIVGTMCVLTIFRHK